MGQDLVHNLRRTLSLSQTNQQIFFIPSIQSNDLILQHADNQLYIQGSGLFYKKYDLTKFDNLQNDCRAFRQQIIDNPAYLDKDLLFDGIYPEPDFLNKEENVQYGEYLYGFFKAPFTGNYKFYLASNDAALFYIQTENPMKDNHSSTPIASNTWNPYKDYWHQYQQDNSEQISSISKNISLIGNQYYFIELFHINKNKSGYLTLSMDIENTNDSESNKQILFEPIPNELLFTYSEKLSIQVQSNGILAGCQTKINCEFTINETKTPTLTQFQIVETQLQLTLNSVIDINSSDLTITFSLSSCTNIQIINSVSPYQIICDLTQQNGNYTQKAGLNQYPQIYDKNIGYVLIDSNLQGIDIPPIITSVSPSSGSPDGGTLVRLTGINFPIDINQNFTLYLPDKVTPLTTNQSEITFITPSTVTENMSIHIDGFIIPIPFTLDQNKRVEITGLKKYKIDPKYDDSNFEIYGIMQNYIKQYKLWYCL